MTQITYTRARMRQLRYACLLHDVGKIGVREHILCKSGRLLPPDMEVIRQRFAALREKSRADCLARALRRSACPPDQLLAQDHARLCADLDAALAVIERSNGTYFLAETDFQALQATAARGWINPVELSHLSIRKGNLTPEEWEDMKSHVTKSWRMLGPDSLAPGTQGRAGSRLLASRALRRLRLSAQLEERGHPPRRTDHGRGGHVRRHDRQRPPLQEDHPA